LVVARNSFDMRPIGPLALEVRPGDPLPMLRPWPAPPATLRRGS
jgi:hypothetical protein